MSKMRTDRERLGEELGEDHDAFGVAVDALTDAQAAELVDALVGAGDEVEAADARAREDATPAGAVASDLPSGVDAMRRWASSLGYSEPEHDDAATLQTVVRRERRRRDNPPLAQQFPDLGPPSVGDWWTYLGRVHGPTASGIRTLEPRTIPELLDDLSALGPSDRVRVTGGRHASSGVAVPWSGQHALLLTQLTDISWDGSGARWGREVQDGRTRVRVPAGISLRTLNAWLRAEGLAMSNLGSYDGQAVFGALTTGTHGSGGHTGPLADAIAAIDLVILDQGPDSVEPRVVRVAPRTGRLPFPDDAPPEVIRSDRVFHAARVGFGCMGIAVAVVLEVEPTFWLRETRTRTTWSDAFSDLEEEVDLHTEQRVHYELLFHPYGDAPSDPVELRRSRTDPLDRPPARRLPPSCAQGYRARGPTSLGKTSQSVLPDTALDLALSSAENCLLGSSGGDPDGEPGAFVSTSDEVLLLRLERYTAATSIELTVPLEAAAETARRLRTRVRAAWHGRPRARLTSPIGLRFVRATDAWLSAMYRHHPQYDRPIDTFATFELPLLLDHRRPRWEANRGLLLDLAATFSRAWPWARLHWGQENVTTIEDVRRLWGPEALAAWTESRRRLDPYGMLENPFTRSTGLDAATWPSGLPAPGGA